MGQGSETTFTPELLKVYLKGVADLDLSEQAVGMYELFTGLVAIMNTLQPDGYPKTCPACTFRPIKE
jgi:hypothetical protein